MKKLLTGLMTLISAVLLVHGSHAATYYIRTDGGSADQCTGAVDASYPGSGSNQPCGWSHPYWAIKSDGSAWKITGGDTLVISPGSYMMGFGAPNTAWCDAGGAFICYLPPIPSGPDPGHPTRILGKGWDSGCSVPPELWGTERLQQVLSLEGSSNVVIDCLEITDHSGCVYEHHNSSVKCEYNHHPYGPWAYTGIYASDSSNVTLKDLNIHGLANTGINAARLTDWVVENVRIAGNGWAGLDGTISDPGKNSNSGTLHFKNWVVEWNGCAETYPGKQPDHCWAQVAGGYGDGVGADRSGGHWIIEDSIFRYNTSDGLDLLYVGVDHPDSFVEIRRSTAIGNAGNQFKVGGQSTIVNSLAIGNCGFFYQKPFAEEMDKAMQSADHCRAGGAAVSINLGQGDSSSIVNSTIVGQGWALIEAQCNTTDFPQQPPCNGVESLTIQNSVFTGYQVFYRSDQRLADFVGDGDPGHYTTGKVDYNVIYNAEISSSTGSHDIFQDPLFVNSSLDSFDGYLQAGSPAVDSGLPVGSLGGLVPADDLSGAPRPHGSGVDRGAYEYGGSVCTYSISPAGQSFGTGGGTGTVSIAAPAGCAWTAASNAAWISITSGASGSGDGSVNYSVSSNAGADRSGTLTIAGKTFTVSQTGALQPETVSTPTQPDGPTSGSPGNAYGYTTGGSSSSKGHSVQYLFDWGDGTNSGWLPVGTVTSSKTWTSTQSFNVRAKARCGLDTSIESDWSDPIAVVISNDGPDLTGSWTTLPRQTCKGTGTAQKCSIKGTFTVNNVGNEDASTTYVNFYLSDNNTYEAPDTRLKSASTGKIKAGKSKAIRFSYNFSKGQSATNKYIIVVIDPGNLVAEIDETNNVVVFGPIQ